MSSSQTNSPKAPSKRVYFLDHVRDFVILWVAMWHASCCYGTHTSVWWYLTGPQTSPIFDVIVLSSELFMMPAIFFVSGYFSLLSLERHRTRVFLMERVKRLWIPFLLGVVFVMPVCNYVQHRVSGGIEAGYFRYWIFDHFSVSKNIVGQLWFLPVLFWFSLILCGVWPVVKKLAGTGGGGAAQESAPCGEPRDRYLILFGVGVALSLFVLNLFVGYGYWAFPFGMRLFGFQPSRTIINIAFFFLGAFAWRKRWFSGDDPPRHIYLWLAGAVLAVGSYLAFYSQFHGEVDTVPWVTLVNSFLHCMVSLTTTVACLRAFRRWLNFKSRPLQFLTVNAYTVYIVHQSILVYLQYTLHDLDWSAYVKQPVVYVVAVGASLLVSECVLRRIPGLKQVL